MHHLSSVRWCMSLAAGLIPLRLRWHAPSERTERDSRVQQWHDERQARSPMLGLLTLLSRRLLSPSARRCGSRWQAGARGLLAWLLVLLLMAALSPVAAQVTTLNDVCLQSQHQHRHVHLSHQRRCRLPLQIRRLPFRLLRCGRRRLALCAGQTDSVRGIMRWVCSDVLLHEECWYLSFQH